MCTFYRHQLNLHLHLTDSLLLIFIHPFSQFRFVFFPVHCSGGGVGLCWNGRELLVVVWVMRYVGGD